MSRQKKELIEIFVDVHESDSDIFSAIGARGLGICTMKHMESGDVVLLSPFLFTVGIELKRGSDFENSLHSGRLSQQICGLYEHYDFPVLIIEDWHPFVGEDDTEDTIKEKVRTHEMTIRTLNRRICVYESKHQEHTIDIITELVRDLKARKLNVIRRKVIIEPGLTPPIAFLASLPHIGVTKAEDLLYKYKSVKEALANVDSWVEFNGITTERLAEIKVIWEGNNETNG